jgi:hypothetical protein
MYKREKSNNIVLLLLNKNSKKYIWICNWGLPVDSLDGFELPTDDFLVAGTLCIILTGKIN